jgi:hypothetical protein
MDNPYRDGLISNEKYITGSCWWQFSQGTELEVSARKASASGVSERKGLMIGFHIES